MRTIIAVSLAVLLTVVPATASSPYGAGDVGFTDYAVSGTPYEGAAEPTIGIPWDTDSVFFHEGATTWRAIFDGDEATWVNVSAATQPSQNLDPMLHVDPDTSRIWAGGLHGACSIMQYSDDDGESWLPAGNICSGSDFDHQSLGSGPAPGAAASGPDSPETHYAYYCGQFGTISCARSTDGGQAWSLFSQEQTGCGGFHGHIRVSRVTGMMAVPVPDCDGKMGLLTMDGDPLLPVQSPTLEARTIPDSEEWTNGFDSSLQFSRDSGWLYYGHASENGVSIAMSKDEGLTWENLGGGMGVTPDHYLDVGQFHDPPVIAGVFADVQVGDDDRVALSFMGLEATANAETDANLRSNDIYRCDNYDGENGMSLNQSDMVWNYYVAMSYDAGSTWAVNKISDNPVQRGGVYDVVVGGGGGCRNLLDFNDMDIDSTGRVHIGYADGCIAECEVTQVPVPSVTCGATSPPNCTPVVGTEGYRASEEHLFRQTSGNGLFSAHDRTPPSSVKPLSDLDADGIPDIEDDDIDGDGVLNSDDAEPYALDDQGTPAIGFLATLAVLAVAFVVRRRS